MAEAMIVEETGDDSSGKTTEEYDEMEEETDTASDNNATDDSFEHFQDVSVNEEDILQHLVACKDVYYRSQQLGEPELTDTEKREIAVSILISSKSNFLARFGKHLKKKHLQFFSNYACDPIDGYAVQYYLSALQRYLSRKRGTDIKNRRYAALQKMQQHTTYFSEKEMMQRNPLLYEQLIGQYLTLEEKKEVENIDTANITFVNLLLEGIEKSNMKEKKKLQEESEASDVIDLDENNKENEEEEDDSMEETVPPNMVKWGEIELQMILPYKPENDPNNLPKLISPSEKRLLKEEFTSIMYQAFLDGKDADFDYSSVDFNDEYDNVDIQNCDAEERYFDSEEPNDIEPELQAISDEVANSTDDDLDLYMENLEGRSSIQKLVIDMGKL